MIKDKQKKFEGSLWEEYSRFEFKWLEIILTKSVLKKSILLAIAKEYGIKFNFIARCRITGNKIGDILLNDVPKDQLLPKVHAIIKKNPSTLTLEEAERLYTGLEKLDEKILNKIYLAVSSNCELKKIVLEDHIFGKEKILFLIIGEFYKNQE